MLICCFQEPLIPLTDYKEMVAAAEKKDAEHLKKVITTMAHPHLDTLAYLCSHLQKGKTFSSTAYLHPAILFSQQDDRQGSRDVHHLCSARTGGEARRSG